MRTHGIIGKLTGAGGGGCVIGLPLESVDIDGFRKEIQAKRYSLLEGALETEGWRVSTD